MREMIACGNARGRRRHCAQQAIDPHAHDEPGPERLDMDIAGAQLDGSFEQIVDRAHDRRAAGEIAQALDVVVGARLGRVASSVALALSSNRAARTVAISSKEAIAICSGAPRTISAARTAAPSVGSATASRVAPAAECTGKMQVSRRKRWENLSVSEGADMSSASADPRQVEKASCLIGEIVRRHFRCLPQLL